MRSCNGRDREKNYRTTRSRTSRYTLTRKSERVFGVVVRVENGFFARCDLRFRDGVGSVDLLNHVEHEVRGTG